MHVVATAGHVDHGKSTLVRALSGMEPDRWAEERRRGMTIDLGFAWTDVPLPGADGSAGGATATIAFVDVPGHQRFLANMLAGVGPVPAVLLVVAADEGWARQTAEHVAALDALGVKHGLLAVTRSDLADPAAATEEALDWLAGTSLARIPAVAVSGTTGAGMKELRAALGSLVAGLPAPQAAERVRLWVDRSFTVKGAGCVVTATLGAGTLRVGDELTLLPGGRLVGVRGLQSLGRATASVEAVARVAVNLRGVGAADVGRGDALVTPGGEMLTRAVDAVRRRPGARAAEARAAPATPAATAIPMTDLPETCVLHVGSAAVAVHVRPLGDSAVRLTLLHPLPLRRGESAVLRDPGQQRIAAGIQIADVDPPGLGRRGAAAARASSLGAGVSVLDEVRQRGAVTREQLALLGVLGRDAPLPAGLRAAGEVVVAAEDWTAWGERVEAAVRQATSDDPLAGGLSADAARRIVTVPTAVPLGPLAASRGLVLAGGRIGLPVVGPVLPGPAAAALEKLLARLGDSPFDAPEAAELPGLGLTPAVIGAAARAGLLMRLGAVTGPPVLLLPQAEDEAVRRLRALPQPFTASQARQALDTSRRVAIPLLEHLDGRRRTRRGPDGARTVLR